MGHFVVDDGNGIALLVASSFKTKKESYLLITSNLYKAQSLYSSLGNSKTSSLDKNDTNEEYIFWALNKLEATTKYEPLFAL